MLSFKRYSYYIVLVFITMMVFQVSVVAQESCLFFSADIPDSRDSILIAEVGKNYDLTVHKAKDLKDEIINLDYVRGFDFVFISESIGSTDAKKLKGAPVPMFTTELWSSKWDVMGWVPINEENTYYGSTSQGENTVTILDGEHFLAAGFEAGTEIEIVSGSTSEDYLTFSVPEIDCIQIAVLSADPFKTIVMGIEKGTVLFNDENVMDGSVVSENRVAAVGIHADANIYLTEDAIKLINAGIKWILGDTTTAIENQNNCLTPNEFSLEQNYPNPFNSTTYIWFSLQKSNHTTLKVYNVIGHHVATLIEKNVTKGNHHVTFNAKDLPTGIYYYKIQSGEFSQVRKMVLIR